MSEKNDISDLKKVVKLPVMSGSRGGGVVSTAGSWSEGQPQSLAAQLSGKFPDNDHVVSDSALRLAVIDALKTIYDPEIPLNVYDLGLIYDIVIDRQQQPRYAVSIQMTLTSPGCPVAEVLVRQVAEKVADVRGVSDARVEIVWDPPWSRDRMSEEAQLELGLI